MKIVIIINLFPPKWLAGTEIATYHLAEHLVKRGHEIHVITSQDEGLLNFEKERGFYVHRIAGPKIRIFGYIPFYLKIFSEIRIIKPNIVHAQDLNMGIPAWLSRKILNIPYIIWGRGDDVYRPMYLIKISSNLILRNADAILALTENMGIKLKEFSSREIFVVPNGINLELFNNMSSPPLREEKIKKIIFVGRLHPVKGVQYLIRAMKRVHEEIPDAVLMLVGDGKERERLEALTIQLGIKKSVKFLGNVSHDEVPPLMHQADIFVLPSISEGFPNVILEAMACGLPVVATRVGGIPDIIMNNKNGYLVEARDIDALANSIVLLLQGDALRKTISENNKQRVKDFTWDKIIAELEKIYQLSIK